MRVVAILQARMNSTRLPGKVMLPLAGKPMLQNIIERVHRAKQVPEVILTCPVSDAKQFYPIVEACRARTAEGHATRQVCLDEWDGDENDLVGRYLEAALRRSADLIVRVPCDNPCVDPAYIDQVVDEYMRYGYIFNSNTTGAACNRWIDGIGAEVFSISRLKWLDERTRGNAEQREHPHLTFYHLENLGETSCRSNRNVQALRLDVNTLDDYHFIEQIYNHFGHNHFTAQDILNCPPVQERVHGRG